MVMMTRRTKMNADAALKIIEDEEGDLDIKNPIYGGLRILEEFTEGELNMRFEHDQIWAGDFDETVDKMHEGVVLVMAKMGWFESDEAWSHFS